MIDTSATGIRWRTLVAVGVAWAAAGLGSAADPEPGADPRPLAGRTLRVAIAPIVTAVDFSNGKPYGAMIDIWDDLAGRLGVSTEFVPQPTFQELMAIVAKGDVDLALGPLAITEDRERTLDLTHPIFHSGLRLAVRQKTDTGFLAAISSLLSWQLLELAGLVLALALISGHLLWWVERRRNPHSFPRGYPRGVIEALWWIASTIVTGGCDDKHVDGPLGRLIAFAWMVGGIGLIAAFTSVLTATLTAEQVTGVIHGPRDLAGRTVGCLTNSVAVDCVAQRGGIVREYATARDAIEALALGMVEAVAGENESLMFLIKQFGADRLKVVGPIFESLDFGIALPNGSPLREPLNTTILRMREDGTLDRIREKWLGKHD
jgi:polar amino acid transport system substrate-binding protein